MQKQFPSKNLAQSYVRSTSFLSNKPTSPEQFLYYPRPQTQNIHYSPQRMNQSLISTSSRTQQTPSFKFQRPSYHQVDPSFNKFLSFDAKQNIRTQNLEGQNPLYLLKTIEQQIRNVESRVQRIQKQERKSDSIIKGMQEMMRLQVKDIKLNQQIEERVNILEEITSYLKSKQNYEKQENQYLRKDLLFQEQIMRLSKEQEIHNQKIRHMIDIFHKLADKIQLAVTGAGSKYEEFIEKNIIKSIEHVNRLTDHYHEEIQSIKDQQIHINQKLKILIDNNRKQSNLNRSLIGISLPNIKITQKIIVSKDEKTQQNSFKRQDQKQFEYSINAYGLQNKLFSSSSRQLQFDKVVYKLDRQYYLLDEQDYYLMDGFSTKIKLTLDQINLLQLNGLID